MSNKSHLWVAVVQMICVPLFCQVNELATFVTPTSNEIQFDFGDGHITDIEEDWNGFIWVSTTKGLYRFDGTEVRAYQESDEILPHSLVYDMFIDHETHRIWLATRGGLSRFDPQTEEAKIFRHDPSDSKSLADDLVRRVIKDRQGRIWVSCANRGLDLLQSDDNSFKHHFYQFELAQKLQADDSQFNLSSLNSFTAVIQDAVSDDLLWLGGPFGLIKFEISNAAFNWIDNPLGQIDAKTPERPVVELYSHDHRLIVGHTVGAYIFDDRTKEIEIIDTETELGPLFRVEKFISYQDLVVVGFRNGLLQLDKSTLKVAAKWIDQPNIGMIYGIRLFDSAGRSWICSSGRFHLHHGFTNIVTSYLLPTPHRKPPSIAKVVNQTALCFTPQHKYYYVFNLLTKKWEVRAFRGLPEERSSQWRDFIKYDDDQILLLEREAIYLLNYETGEVAEVPNDFNLVRGRFTKLLLDDEHLWISSLDHGLFRLNLMTGISTNYINEFNTERHLSAYTWITDLHQDIRRNTWIRLGRGFAVHEADKDKFSVYHPDDVQHSFRYIRNFAENNQGEVWLSSEDNGIGMVEANDLEEGIIRFINTDSGLSSNNIQQIEFDDNGLLWILHDLGIDTYDPKSGTIRKSTWSLGIPPSSQFFFLPDGDIALLLSTGGIGVFDPELLVENRPVPEPYMTKVRIRDRFVFQGNRLGLENLTILTSRDFLGFEFSALGFLNPKEFAYQLVGVDEHWIETTERQTASYSNLRPGQYTFALKARNAGDVWSDVKRISVYLAPQWYETTWFKLLCALVAFAGIYGLYRWRLNSVRKNERIKSDFKQRLNEVEMQALRSQMNPHFLFNSLNSIQHFIIKNQPREAVDYLNRFSRLVRLILQHSRTKLVTLKEELDALKLYLDLENLRFKNRFTYEISVDPSISQHDIEIPPMLLQPFVENAIWHGLLHKKESGIIKISIERQDETLLCAIEDNGVGRKASAARKSNFNQERKSMGMSITKNRLDIINYQHSGEAAVEIHDLESKDGTSKGTRVEISLPV